MNLEYYKEYYHFEREHWWFVVRNRLLMEHVERITSSEKKPLKILNIGVGTGRTSELLSRFGEVTSVEYEEECISFVKEHLDLEIQHGSILELDFEDNSFDLVCAFDVIEHVEDDKLAVSEMKRVCKSGGVAMVSVPALMMLWGTHDEINHHFRRYNYKELSSLFSNDGKIIFQSFFNTYLFPPIAIVRIFNRFLTKKTDSKKEGTGSDFSIKTSPLVSSILKKVFYSESIFLNRFISLPIGVSILLSWRK
jgi:ubiquinone/menaquinone biosynthesis C-methylase UbiE